jgi:hypothetical protein
MEIQSGEHAGRQQEREHAGDALPGSPASEDAGCKDPEHRKGLRPRGHSPTQEHADQSVLQRPARAILPGPEPEGSGGAPNHRGVLPERLTGRGPVARAESKTDRDG